jgi:CRP-like cAMP-binding protein
LVASLAQWGQVPATAEPELRYIFRPWSCDAGQPVVRPGEALDEVLFVQRGLLRFYTLDETGREWNKGFAVEGGLSGPLSDDAPHWPAPYGVEALERVQGLRAAAGGFRALCAAHRELDDIVRHYLARLLEDKGARLESLQRLDAGARYRKFLTDSPELARRLPQYHIASYLGMSEISLSRLRGAAGARD